MSFWPLLSSNSGEELPTESSGVNSAGAGANNTGVGTVAWSNPGNIVSSNNSRATAASTAASASTNYLVASSFGFDTTDIPDDTDNFVVVFYVEMSEVLSDVVAGTYATEAIARLVKNGVVQTSNRAQVRKLPSTETVYEIVFFGSDLDGWEASDFRSSSFGLAFACDIFSDGSTVTARVDHVQAEVQYSMAEEGATVLTYEIGLQDTLIDANDPDTDYSAANPLQFISILFQRGIYLADISSLPDSGTITDSWIRFQPPPGPQIGIYSDLPLEIARALIPSSVTQQATWNTRDGTVPWLTPGGGSNDFDIPGQAVGLFDVDESVDPILGAYRTVNLKNLIIAARAAGQTTIRFRIKWQNEVDSTGKYKHASAEAAADLRPVLVVEFSGTPPGSFTYISPTNGTGSQNQCGVTLQWNESSGADSYNVYFGTSPNPPLVATGITVTAWMTPPLVSGTNYYWKIVAVNEDGETEGPIWGFSTRAAMTAASSPNPANAATGVSVNPTYSFLDSNAFTPQFDFFIWKVGDAQPANPVLSNVTSGFTAFTLQFNSQYRWFIRSYDGCTFVNSTTWTFTTAAAGGSVPGAPTDPSPGAEADCEVDVAQNTAELEWTNGANTDEVMVFFSTDPALLGQGVPTYGPGAVIDSLAMPVTLVYGQTYYWQVYNINAFGATAGPIWCFTVEDDPNPPPGGDPPNPPFRRYYRQYRLQPRQRT